MKAVFEDLINLVVRADAFDEDGFRALVFDELEDDTQVVARAARL